MPQASLRARNIGFALREGPAGEAATRGNDMSSDNTETAKKAYAAYGVGDVETAVGTFGDDYVTIGPQLLSGAQAQLFDEEPGFEARFLATAA